jgi:hypothetical protein
MREDEGGGVSVGNTIYRDWRHSFPTEYRRISSSDQSLIRKVLLPVCQHLSVFLQRVLETSIDAYTPPLSLL